MHYGQKLVEDGIENGIQFWMTQLASQLLETGNGTLKYKKGQVCPRHRVWSITDFFYIGRLSIRCICFKIH